MPDTIKKISSAAGRAIRIARLDGATIVATGIFIDSKLCFYNSELDTIKTVGKVPGNITNEIHKYQYTQTSDIVKNDDIKRIAFACKKEGDILEIHNYSGEIVKTIHGPDVLKPFWIDKKQVQNRVATYNGICATAEHIFAIYSGEIPGSMKNWLAAQGKNIFVFDWDGNPIKRIRTKQRVCDIIISESRNIMYAVYYDGEYFRIGYHQL